MPAGIQSGFIGEPSFMDNKNMCPQCGKMLINLPEGECCPACREMNLFADVRDYIRKEDVNEIEVADHFGLPVSRVKEWIRQGRIEYKETPNGVRVLSSGYCELCGQPVAFGIICPKCKHKLAQYSQLFIHHESVLGDPPPHPPRGGKAEFYLSPVL